MSELKSFDRVADVYDETRALPADAERAIADAILAEVTRVAPKPLLLEIGIGTGRIAVPLAERGVRIVGTDIAPRMLNRLRTKRIDIAAVRAEAARAPFRTDTFDAACSCTSCTLFRTLKRRYARRCRWCTRAG